MCVAKHGVVVCAPVLIIRAKRISTLSTHIAVFRAEVVSTRVTRLCMGSTGDGVTNGALYSVSPTNVVVTDSARFEMIRTERIGAQIARIGVRWAGHIITLCAGSGIITADNVVADSTLPAISSTDLLSTSVT